MEDHNALPIYSDPRENGPVEEDDFKVYSPTPTPSNPIC